LAQSTKRSKITSFIANKKSRQEFEPLIGRHVDKIHVEPLHLKNNACALAHRYLLNDVIAISNVGTSVTSFSQVSSTSPFAKYIKAMRNQCSLSRLANKIVRWFDETKGEGK
jgi:hypothetical protein